MEFRFLGFRFRDNKTCVIEYIVLTKMALQSPHSDHHIYFRLLVRVTVCQRIKTVISGPHKMVCLDNNSHPESSCAKWYL